MASADASVEDEELPPWLTDHVNIQWNSDDINALVASIDASQSAQPPALPPLPAELLLLILESVPVAYVLDWRLVCRGFRDAIDGPILYRQLQRLQLFGYLGPSSLPERVLGPYEYERLRYVPTRIISMERPSPPPATQRASEPPWTSTHAVFKMRRAWFAAALKGPRRISDMLSTISGHASGRPYGALTWIVKLDTAVLDLDIPFERHRKHFDFDVYLKTCTMRMEWKPMLFRFLRTERAFRLLMEKKHASTFTFSHAEDCLRAIRRQALHAALDPDSKIDRHIKWTMRLLRPLWGVAGHRDHCRLDPAEADAVRVLLLLRREASLSTCQIRHLHQLAHDYNAMLESVDTLAKSFKDLKQQLVMHGHSSINEMDVSRHDQLPASPISWSDELRADVEMRVRKWKATQKLIEQMQALMVTSQEALTVPEDAFDVRDSELGA